MLAGGQAGRADLKKTSAVDKPSRSYVISLDNRKARGSGHERFEEILGAARELFLEHGIENVSTRQIATRVGLSQTGLYVYFKTKDEMLDKLVEGAFRKLGQKLREVETRSNGPLEYLQGAIPAYIRFGVENPDEYRLAFLLRDARRKAGMIAPEQRQTVGVEEFGVLEGHVANGLACGALRSSASSPKAVAQALWAAIHGLVALLLAYPDFDWVHFDDLLSAHTEMLLHGLLAQPQASQRRSRHVGKAVHPEVISAKRRPGSTPHKG